MKFEMNGKPVGKEERFPLRKIWRNLFLVEFGHGRVRHHEGDHIAAARGFGGVIDLETLSLGLGARRAAGRKPDNDLDAAVMQIERMGVPLTAVTDDSDSLSRECL